MKSIIRCVYTHMKQRDDLFSNAEHEACQRCVLHRAAVLSESCSAIGAAILASLGALWLLLPTGGQRGCCGEEGE